MSKPGFSFDTIGIVVDWIDALKHRRLNDLLDLYANNAKVECCDGGTFSGRQELAEYWRPRLQNPEANAFEIIALMPENERIWLDYVGYDGGIGRTIFRFTEQGTIRSTTCDEVKIAA
jgi:SnoaL-like domain